MDALNQRSKRTHNSGYISFVSRTYQLKLASVYLACSILCVWHGFWFHIEATASAYSTGPEEKSFLLLWTMHPVPKTER